MTPGSSRFDAISSLIRNEHRPDTEEIAEYALGRLFAFFRTTHVDRSLENARDLAACCLLCPSGYSGEEVAVTPSEFYLPCEKADEYFPTLELARWIVEQGLRPMVACSDLPPPPPVPGTIREDQVPL